MIQLCEKKRELGDCVRWEEREMSGEKRDLRKKIIIMSLNKNGKKNMSILFNAVNVFQLKIR